MDVRAEVQLFASGTFRVFLWLGKAVAVSRGIAFIVDIDKKRILTTFPIEAMNPCTVCQHGDLLEFFLDQYEYAFLDLRSGRQGKRRFKQRLQRPVQECSYASQGKWMFYSSGHEVVRVDLDTHESSILAAFEKPLRRPALVVGAGLQSLLVYGTGSVESINLTDAKRTTQSQWSHDFSGLQGVVVDRKQILVCWHGEMTLYNAELNSQQSLGSFDGEGNQIQAYRERDLYLSVTRDGALVVFAINQ